ncbi:pyroglutamyl peptidase [Nocardiopsis coralliicola]
MHSTATTPEEERAALDAPQALLRRSGFAAAAPLFAADLDRAADLAEAQQAAAEHGHRLWSEAVAARDRVGDDRPLYWARLSLVARLRAWQPSFPLDEADRAGLLDRLESASRGLDDLVFAPDDRQLRVIVTGFDPFGLDEDVRRSNPSGVAALALQGEAFEAGGRTAVVRTAVFPVRWRDFTGGIVERCLARHYAGGPVLADAVITVSRGRGDAFELEAFNAAWRGDAPDNERVRAPGPVPSLPDDRPQWTESTLPRGAIVREAAGAYPVHDHRAVAEVPAGGGAAVERPDGPSPDSQARRGSGGDYLSNEVAYRNTFLRDTAGRSIPAGHVHTPCLELDPSDPDALTGPAFEETRAAITEQLRSIVRTAVRTSAAADEDGNG